MNRGTLEQIDAALEGSIPPEQHAKLQQTLLDDPDALDHYCRQAQLDAGLHWELANTSAPAAPAPAPRRDRVFKLVVAASWAAAAALVTATVFTILNHRTGPTPPSPTAGGDLDLFPSGTVVEMSVARITKSDRARWQSATPLQLGSWLNPGTLDLTAGTAEITFDNGAAVILEAPATIELIDADHAQLLAGKATANVPPPAIGFVLDTPETAIRDLGTAFSVQVSPTGQTEVHVIDGLVEASRDADTPGRLIRENQAVRFAGGTSGSVPFAADQFVTDLAQDDASLDPSRYVHWSFDATTPDDSGFQDTGKHVHPDISYPAIARFPHTPTTGNEPVNVPGRFGQALFLDGGSAFLSSAYPGIAGDNPRTVAFWIRIPPNTHKRHAYAVTAWGVPGSMSKKWQLGWNPNYTHSYEGEPGAIRTEFGLGYVIGSTDLRDGQWHHVASVFLGGSHVDVATHIRHYVDGKLESITGSRSQLIDTRTDDPKSRPTSIGRYLNRDRIPFFTGLKASVDELYIFEGALTPGQIEALYLENRPPDLLVP